ANARAGDDPLAPSSMGLWGAWRKQSLRTRQRDHTPRDQPRSAKHQLPRSILSPIPAKFPRKSIRIRGSRWSLRLRRRRNLATYGPRVCPISLKPASGGLHFKCSVIILFFWSSRAMNKHRVVMTTAAMVLAVCFAAPGDVAAASRAAAQSHPSIERPPIIGLAHVGLYVQDISR